MIIAVDKGLGTTVSLLRYILGSFRTLMENLFSAMTLINDGKKILLLGFGVLCAPRVLRRPRESGIVRFVCKACNFSVKAGRCKDLLFKAKFDLSLYLQTLQKP